MVVFLFGCGDVTIDKNIYKMSAQICETHGEFDNLVYDKGITGVTYNTFDVQCGDNSHFYFKQTHTNYIGGGKFTAAVWKNISNK